MKADSIGKEYLESNKHSRIEYVIKRSPPPFKNREFVNKFVWRISVNEDEASMVVIPILHDGRPVTAEFVRGRMPCFFNIKRTVSNESRITLVMQLDPGGAIPKVLMKFYVRYNLRRVTAAQNYFQELRPLEVYDERDGIAIGEVFAIKTKREKEERKEMKTSADQVSLLTQL